MATLADVLQFWFGTPFSEEASYGKRRKLWFGKSDQTDQIIRDRFLALHAQAVAGTLDDWEESPQGCLALLVLLDQFSRHLFRGQARAFAADAKALALAKRTIAQGWDQQLDPLQRIFVYLPLEHSENLADQQRSVELFQALQQTDPSLADVCDYALRHQAVIVQFGRFPHRNAILGRESTPAELAFLEQPGSSF
jgi:uncharacterized protein (DUF924 family)